MSQRTLFQRGRVWELSWNDPPFSTDFYNFYFFVNINTGIPPCRIEKLNNAVVMVQRGEEKRETIDQAERDEGSEAKPVNVCFDQVTKESVTS